MRTRLLLIDDEELLLRALKRSLSRHYDVVTMSSALGALALLQVDRNFDVILCDMTMPGLTGIQLYQAVCDLDPELGARFNFLTGGAFAPEVERFLDLMAERTLTKPVEMSRLVAFITAAARGHRSVPVAAAALP